jgi:hypothetical protein
MYGVRFIRLEDFINENDEISGMIIHLEPQGLLFATVRFFSFINYLFINLLKKSAPKLK